MSLEQTLIPKSYAVAKCKESLITAFPIDQPEWCLVIVQLIMLCNWKQNIILILLQQVCLQVFLSSTTFSIHVGCLQEQIIMSPNSEVYIHSEVVFLHTQVNI
jgi:hypothetical protein